jgi:hypothetical protein
MLLETMTVKEVAQMKGVSDAAIRFVVNDPQSDSLLGIKNGGRLLILAPSAHSYTPRNYPRMKSFLELADYHQLRLREILESLAADMAGEHPLAAHIVRCFFPGGNIAENGVPGYWLALVLEDSDSLEIDDHADPDRVCVIFPSDSDNIVRQKARQWALNLVEKGWVKNHPVGIK